VRHLQNVDIALSDTERRHLILTGKNGSGKTSLLEAMRDCILLKQRKKIPQELDKATLDKISRYLYSRNITIKPGVDISYSDDNIRFADVVFAYLSAGRDKLAVPNSIEPVDIVGKTVITRNASIEFLKYILSLDYQLYGAKTDKNAQLEANLEKWFDNFLQALREIYGCPELKLQRDTKNLLFKIDMPGREPFGLHEMSDGYAAFLDIFMELLMRLESADAVVEYTQPAIVLIDEIETHLHVELQKRVLPFLTKMFPNIQFIAATHSPFVITSLSNAAVFDLEKNERLENLSFYSYETVVESFLDTDLYSDQLKSYF
jgi:predicted ATP-dependent endonuclease of OLD family